MQILLADDSPEVRSALRLIIEQVVGYRVAGESADAAELVTHATDCRPDIVLLDWELPGLRTVRATLIAHLRQACPGIAVVGVSGRPEAAQEAADAGVEAFVSKSDPPSKLLAVLDELWHRA